MWEYIQAMVGSTTVEYIAVICGFLNVYLIIRRSMWNYLFGFIMVVLYAKVFFDYQLYSDSMLQVFFFVTQFYGLWYWLKHKAPDGKVIVEPLSNGSFLTALGWTIALWALLSYVVGTYTDASHPAWDSAIASLSVTAQILLMRRHYQAWYLWITVDILAIGLFYIKDLQPTAVLYAVFLILASIGLVQWKKASNV